eukprot:COSAG01_NODE_33406_length_564_cov_4.193548_1_plen_90_part_00
MARDKCGFQTIDVFVGQWMPDATAIERKLHRKFMSRPRDTKHPLGAPRCWRVAEVTPGLLHVSKEMLAMLVHMYSRIAHWRAGRVKVDQ